MGRARRLIDAGGTDERWVLPPPRLGAAVNSKVSGSVEDRRFDVAARGLAGSFATCAVAAFRGLLARLGLASVDCVGFDAVAAFVSVCLHGMNSLKRWLATRRLALAEALGSEAPRAQLALL